MKQEDKQLLLVDLSARLPYDVKILVDDNVETLEGINTLDNVAEFGSFLSSDIEEIKPYLFLLSSMTEKQKLELTTLKTYVSLNKNREYLLFDWLNAHHLDYRGLIEKGLAIDATNLNIY